MNLIFHFNKDKIYALNHIRHEAYENTGGFNK
jgi:hypothetical protein